MARSETAEYRPQSPVPALRLERRLIGIRWLRAARLDGKRLPVQVQLKRADGLPRAGFVRSRNECQVLVRAVDVAGRDPRISQDSGSRCRAVLPIHGQGPAALDENIRDLIGPPRQGFDPACEPVSVDVHGTRIMSWP